MLEVSCTITNDDSDNVYLVCSGFNDVDAAALMSSVLATGGGLLFAVHVDRGSLLTLQQGRQGHHGRQF